LKNKMKFAKWRLKKQQQQSKSPNKSK
jgi:hypothetical protein